MLISRRPELLLYRASCRCQFCRSMRMRGSERLRLHYEQIFLCHKMSAVAADVSDWIRTPAPLNYNKSGENAVFTSDNSVLQRRDPVSDHGGCVSYTAHPLPLGQVWQTTVLETTTTMGYGLVSGCVPSLLYHYIIWCVSRNTAS